jgi:hypothetical protein
MKKLLIFAFAVLCLAGCSKEAAKRDFIEEAGRHNRQRIEYKEKATADNYTDYTAKTRDLITEVEAMPEISGWEADDSLKVNLKKALEGDIKYYESLQKKPGTMDELYDNLTRQSNNLGYDIAIMKILIDETEKLQKKE